MRSNQSLIFVIDNDISAFSEATYPQPGILKKKKQRNSFLPVIGFVTFGIIYMLPIMQQRPIEHSCLALLYLVSYFWATDSVVSHAIAFIVPVIGVWLTIGYESQTGLRVSADQLAMSYAWKLMDPVVLMFLGSMVISDCLAKFAITNRVSNFVFNRMSKKPFLILLTLMFVNLFLAAFFSNIASTTLLLELVVPIIRTLDPEDPFIKALLFGLAWSGNIGGMMTPIATAVNILAIAQMATNGIYMSFVKWMEFSVPTCLTTCFLFWIYLVLKFPCQRSTICVIPDEKPLDPWSLNHTYVVIITVVTIVLWVLQETLSFFLGHVGITSLIPVVLFFGFDLLSVRDFQRLKWQTLFLMGGGLCLGEVMNKSGLLNYVSNSGELLSGIPLWPLLMIFLTIIGFAASLINSVSAAAILYPIITSFGSATGRPNLLVALAALMISGAHLFHISSYPNALMCAVYKHKLGFPEELTTEPFITGTQFFFNGWPTIFIGILIVGSIGFFIGLELDFG